MSSPTSSASHRGLPADERIKKIADLASNVAVNPQVKAANYLRSGREMYRSAQNYQEDGSLENAYILYVRFLTLFVEKIKVHPGYKDVPPADKLAMTKYCKEVLPKAEQIKTKLLEKYSAEYEEYLKQVKLFQEQLEKEEKIRREKEEAERKRRAENLRSNVTYSPDITDIISKTRENRYVPSAPSIDVSQFDSPPSASTGTYYADLWEDANGTTLSPISAGGAPTTPQFDRSSKPNRILSPICTGLRQVIIPGDTSQKFLEFAKSNTSRNTETMGILSGKIMREKLVITTIIIPQQSGTANECNMEKEEEIFTLQDKDNLITLGWIHTHPSQTAFLSSVDLHTQHALQCMMPEAIAIVCSGLTNETGIYTINPSTGMEVIGNCQKTGFHTHPDSSVPIFHSANHAIVDNTRSIKVCDLRK